MRYALKLVGIARHSRSLAYLEKLGRKLLAHQLVEASATLMGTIKIKIKNQKATHSETRRFCGRRNRPAWTTSQLTSSNQCASIPVICTK